MVFQLEPLPEVSNKRIQVKKLVSIKNMSKNYADHTSGKKYHW